MGLAIAAIKPLAVHFCCCYDIKVLWLNIHGNRWRPRASRDQIMTSTSIFQRINADLKVPNTLYCKIGYRMNQSHRCTILNQNPVPSRAQQIILVTVKTPRNWTCFAALYDVCWGPCNLYQHHCGISTLVLLISVIFTSYTCIWH